MGAQENKGVFKELTTLPLNSLKKPRKEKYPSTWSLWQNLGPERDHYAGVIQCATARRHNHRQDVRVKRRADQTHQQRETASAATEANIRNHTRNTLFQD